MDLDRDFDHNRHPRGAGSDSYSQPAEITRAVKGELADLMNDFGAKMKRPAGTGLFQESNMDGSATTTNCFYFSTSPAGFQEGGLR